MNKTLLSICCTLLFVWPCHASQSFQRATESILNDLRNITGVPGFSFSLVADEQKPLNVTSGVINLKSKKPVHEKHLFRLASVSKVIGATLFYELIQQGKLDPDIPIGNYMPGLPDSYKNITTRQLFSHTSGMPHYQPMDSEVGSVHYESATAALESVQMNKRKLLDEPGNIYHYSSHAYTLLGALYETITASTLESGLQKYIHSLTGRNTPKIENSTRRNPLRSNLFERQGQTVVTAKFDDKTHTILGGGLTASAEDLALFGDRVLHDSSLDEDARTFLFTPNFTNDGGVLGRQSYQVGFGWRISTDNNQRDVYHHAGVTLGARSVLGLYPKEGVAVTLLSNMRWTAQIERTVFALAELYFSAPERIYPTHLKLSGEFDGQPLSGSIMCQQKQCFVSDHKGALTTWLNQYNPTGEEHWQWPAYFYESVESQMLILVTKIGLISLHGNEQKLKGTVGQARALSMVFGKH